MTSKEKILYHQIHPLKLGTDISVSIVTTYFLWHHNVFWFFIFLTPSAIASFLIIKFVDLEKLKESSLGKYIEKYMTLMMEVIRLSGAIIIMMAGWYHSPFRIVIGCLVVIAAWCKGLLFKRE